MADQRLHLPEELHRMRELRVAIERRLVDPLGVNVKEPGIADGTELLIAAASGLRTGGCRYLAESCHNGIFLPRASVESPDDEEFSHLLLAPEREEVRHLTSRPERPESARGTRAQFASQARREY